MSDITVHNNGSMTCTCGWKVEKYNTFSNTALIHNCVLFLKVKVEELEISRKTIKHLLDIMEDRVNEFSNRIDGLKEDNEKLEDKLFKIREARLKEHEY